MVEQNEKLNNFENNNFIEKTLKFKLKLTYVIHF